MTGRPNGPPARSDHVAEKAVCRGCPGRRMFRPRGDKMTKRTHRLARLLTAAAVLAGPSVVGLSAAASTSWAAPAALDRSLIGAHSASSNVIVSGRPGAGEAVAAAVRAHGGAALRALPIVDGVS